MFQLGSRRGSPEGPATQRGDARARQRGQVLAIFAVATILFVGILAIVIDVSWYWANSLRVQRAADAAALAGVVWLPGSCLHRTAVRLQRGVQGRLHDRVGGVTVSATQDSTAVSGGDPNQLDVTVTASVNTFFMRLFGINSITATRSSKAIYVLPVPMGSPQNYYGDFGKVRYPGSGESVTDHHDSDGRSQARLPRPVRVGTVDQPRQRVLGNQLASPPSVQNHCDQSWNTFTCRRAPAGATVMGIQLIMSAKAATAVNCTLTAAAVMERHELLDRRGDHRAHDHRHVLWPGWQSDTWGHAWSRRRHRNGKFISS